MSKRREDPEIENHRRCLIRCGAGLFPDISQFRETVLKYLAVMTQLSPQKSLNTPSGKPLCTSNDLQPLMMLD